MMRTKRRLIRRLALGLAIAAIVPPIAQARPTDMSGTDLRSLHAKALAASQYRLGPGEIPSVRATSVGPVPIATDLRSLHAEALASSQYNPGPGEIPPVEEGFPWPSSEQGMPATVAEDASGYDISYGVVSSAAIFALLLIAGSVVVVRRVRQTRLAPA
jgi:hypothetical protein